MSQITIASFPYTLAQGSYTTGTVKLRVWFVGGAGDQFIDADGSIVPYGNATSFFKEITCSVAANVITVPSFTLPATDNSSNISTAANAQFYVNGAPAEFVFSSWIITATLGSSVTFNQLYVFNLAVSLPYTLDATYLTAPQVAALIAASIPDPGGEDITNVTQSPYNVDNTGAASPYAGFAAAISAGVERIYLPAGTYKFTQADVTAHPQLINFYFGSSNLEFFGDGIGKTIITVADGVTYNPSDTTVLSMANGTNQSVHGITFQGPATYTSGNVNVISAASTCKKPHIYDFEVTGWSADATAGAGCVNTFESYAATDVATTLGTTIVAGSRTVTPASMANIYKGRRLVIGGTTETVVVTNVTTTTFTATFANAHDAGDNVIGYINGMQGAIVEQFYIHDNPKATAIIANSNGNIFRDGIIKRIGTTNNQQGLYVQGGQNLFDGIWIEGVYGYSIHQYPTFGSVTEASGNVYNNIKSIDPGNFHVLISAEFDDTSNGNNILYPSGTGLSRYTVITNCLFRNTRPETGTTASLALMGPTYFDGNVLEDVTYIDSRNASTVITPNNISRAIFGTTIARIPSDGGGGIERVDIVPSGRMISGRSAFPGAVTNTAGGNLEIASGVGSRKFTVVSNTAGAVAVTINNTDGLSFTLTSGVDFTLGSDNTGTQLAVTATNLAAAINTGTNASRLVQAIAVGPDVYVLKLSVAKAGDVVPFVTLSTNQAGRISATNGTDGNVRVWNGLQWASGTKPSADAAHRGMVWYVAGGAGVADTFEVCRKDAADAYAWVTLF